MHLSFLNMKSVSSLPDTPPAFCVIYQNNQQHNRGNLTLYNERGVSSAGKECEAPQTATVLPCTCLGRFLIHSCPLLLPPRSWFLVSITASTAEPPPSPSLAGSQPPALWNKWAKQHGPRGNSLELYLLSHTISWSLCTNEITSCCIWRVPLLIWWLNILKIIIQRRHFKIN